ncbi:hypothetical protein OJ996_12830 [Luteolibacter sp. GHJ8]|jgi:hypothetical protein|uniref:Uncharacterized protein n=1 Tax=Luteolibacter rhizosphaerae TaxID=2989719 RepID=A0ABT3G5G1_9BACT|nr:hypothetical protein [Luteolibacter rhizosphaerae]MCW1914465.1 hypothetical protein [Luteolibacter rhizosphaerae]
MKSFDPMNSGGDSDFERELLGMELRRPPAEWKALLLPKPVPPLFTKPFLLGLAACWAASAAIYFSTPETELPGPPVLLPPQNLPEIRDNVLAYQPENI